MPGVSGAAVKIKVFAKVTFAPTPDSKRHEL